MNGPITSKEYNQREYKTFAFAFLKKLVARYHAQMPQHIFLSSLISVGTQGHRMDHEDDVWEEFKAFSAAFNVPFDVEPSGIFIDEDNEISYGFSGSQRLSGRLKGDIIEFVAIFSTSKIKFFDFFYEDDLEDRMTASDWKTLASSLEQKYMLLSLDEA